jgi:hypothetical protein
MNDPRPSVRKLALDMALVASTSGNKGSLAVATGVLQAGKMVAVTVQWLHPTLACGCPARAQSSSSCGGHSSLATATTQFLQLWCSSVAVLTFS